MIFGAAGGLPLMNGAEYASETASVNGTTLHYMPGGAGPTVIARHTLQGGSS